jgi:hypothetical protein
MVSGKRKRNWQRSIQYGFVRTRELEGTMGKGPRHGAYLLSAMRVRAGWGELSDKRWPYDGHTWPPLIPPEAADFDRIASFNRIEGYFAIRNNEEAKYCLAAGLPFQVTVRTTNDWRNPPGGVIPLTLSRDPRTFGENHCVLVTDYDDKRQQFTFLNSWDPSWGDGGVGYLPYSYVRYYMTEAWAAIPSRLSPPAPRPGLNGISIYQTETPSGFPIVQTSTFNESGVRTGWCFVVVRDGHLEVEDFFVRPDVVPIDPALKLAEGLISLRDQSALPIRVWLSHCDAELSYNPQIKHLIEGLELTSLPSKERVG